MINIPPIKYPLKSWLSCTLNKDKYVDTLKEGWSHAISYMCEATKASSPMLKNVDLNGQ